MADSTEIEVLEGESLEDAVKRVAKAMAPPKPKKASSKKPSKHRPHKGDPTPPVGEGEPPIYAAFHMYLLPGRTEAKLRSDAARERQMYGPGVQVFVHLHQPGEGCKDNCVERVE